MNTEQILAMIDPPSSPWSQTHQGYYPRTLLLKKTSPQFLAPRPHQTPR